MRDNRAFFLAGKENEKRFRDMFSGVSESTPYDDVHRKFDMVMELKIDFKGMKRKDRNGPLNQDLHWIELRNVAGNRGWLYGDADIFVFEIINYYIVVAKEDLQKLIAKRVVKEVDIDGKPIFKKELYRLYNRKGRKDVITMVPTVELCAISILMIPKDDQ